MDDKAKKDFIELFNQGFEEVVLPHIEDLNKKVSGLEGGLQAVEKEVQGLKKDVKKLDKRVGRVENKLDRLVDRVDDHETWIGNLENPPSPAPSF